MSHDPAEHRKFVCFCKSMSFTWFYSFQFGILLVMCPSELLATLSLACHPRTKPPRPPPRAAPAQHVAMVSWSRYGWILRVYGFGTNNPPVPPKEVGLGWVGLRGLYNNLRFGDGTGALGGTNKPKHARCLRCLFDRALPHGHDLSSARTAIWKLQKDWVVTKAGFSLKPKGHEKKGTLITTT